MLRAARPDRPGALPDLGALPRLRCAVLCRAGTCKLLGGSRSCRAPHAVCGGDFLLHGEAGDGDGVDVKADFQAGHRAAWHSGWRHRVRLGAGTRGHPARAVAVQSQGAERSGVRRLVAAESCLLGRGRGHGRGAGNGVGKGPRGKGRARFEQRVGGVPDATIGQCRAGAVGERHVQQAFQGARLRGAVACACGQRGQPRRHRLVRVRAWRRGWGEGLFGRRAFQAGRGKSGEGAKAARARGHRGLGKGHVKNQRRAAHAGGGQRGGWCYCGRRVDQAGQDALGRIVVPEDSPLRHRQIRCKIAGAGEGEG
mmetsp:Transcript_33122/g.100062  ORF Transcript_33122/g.100062 Transcript_33122/m.100062 type:complete len:311 (+) Transcript_33122:465-1397(+)